MWPFKRKDWRVQSATPRITYLHGKRCYVIDVTYADGRTDFARYSFYELSIPYTFDTEQEASDCADWYVQSQNA